MSSMTQRTTFELMSLISLNRDRMRSSHWKVLPVSLTRLTKTSPLHRNSYSVHGVLRCKEVPRNWTTVKGSGVLPVSLDRVIVDPIK